MISNASSGTLEDSTSLACTITSTDLSVRFPITLLALSRTVPHLHAPLTTLQLTAQRRRCDATSGAILRVFAHDLRVLAYTPSRSEVEPCAGPKWEPYAEPKWWAIIFDGVVWIVEHSLSVSHLRERGGEGVVIVRVVECQGGGVAGWRAPTVKALT